MTGLRAGRLWPERRVEVTLGPQLARDLEAAAVEDELELEALVVYILRDYLLHRPTEGYAEPSD